MGFGRKKTAPAPQEVKPTSSHVEKRTEGEQTRRAPLVEGQDNAPVQGGSTLQSHGAADPIGGRKRLDPRRTASLPQIG